MTFSDGPIEPYDEIGELRMIRDAQSADIARMKAVMLEVVEEHKRAANYCKTMRVGGADWHEDIVAKLSKAAK